MGKLSVKFLGTSAAEGWPGVFCMCESCARAQKLGGKNLRLRSSALINGEMLVDLSPDFTFYKMKYGIDVSKLKTVLVTHTHIDHFYPQLLGYNTKSYSVKPPRINLLCSAHAAEIIEKTDFDKNNSLDNFKLTVVKPYESYEMGDYTVVPLEASHNAPQSLIYLISYGGINYLYGNDTAMLNEKVLKYLKGIRLDIVSLDGTMGKNKGQYYRHMGFDEIISLKEFFTASGNCSNDTQFIATHFTHFINMPHEEIEGYFAPHGIRAAYDGLTVETVKN